MTRDVDYIITECQEIARSHGLDFEYDHGLLYPGNVTVRFVNNNDQPLIKTFKYNDLLTSPREFIRNIVAELEDEWFNTKEKPQSYRDILVEQIKAAGQDLIDRAESFVAADLKMIGGFNICIDFPQDGPVEILTSMNTYCMNDNYYKDVVYYADNKPVLVVKGE